MHITIKRVSDGAIASGTMDFEYSDFVWKEGNFSCDCNRAIFFHEFRDEDEGDIECGDGGFLVRIVEDGIVVFDEIGPVFVNVAPYQYQSHGVIVPVYSNDE